MAFVSLFIVLFLPEMDQIIIRQVAQSPQHRNKIFSAALWIRVFSAPLTLGLMILVGIILGYSSDQRFFFLLTGLALGLSIIADAPRMVFQGLELMELDTFSRLIEKGITLIFAWLGILFFPKLTIILFAMIIGSAAGLMVSVILYRKFQNDPIAFSARNCYWMIVESSSMIGSVALLGLSFRLPQVILSQYQSASQVGLYNIAFSVIFMISYLSLAFSGAYLPLIGSCSIQYSRRPITAQNHIVLHVCIKRISGQYRRAIW
jgi:O-antigen/teichoic acid export membrane protein